MQKLLEIIKILEPLDLDLYSLEYTKQSIRISLTNTYLEPTDRVDELIDDLECLTSIYQAYTENGYLKIEFKD